MSLKVLAERVTEGEDFLLHPIGKNCSETGASVTGPPKTDFESEKYIIILYLFCTILYTKSKISCTLPSSAIRNSNLGDGDMQPTQMQF